MIAKEDAEHRKPRRICLDPRQSPETEVRELPGPLPENGSEENDLKEAVHAFGGKRWLSHKGEHEGASGLSGPNREEGESSIIRKGKKIFLIFFEPALKFLKRVCSAVDLFGGGVFTPLWGLSVHV